SCLFILHCIGVQRAIHSFPTRRSSDLVLSAISLFGIGVYILLNLFRKNIKKLFYGSVLFIVAVICFGLPLAKKINPNTDYRGPEVLNTHIQTLNVPVYEFYNFAPELIWEYGEAIPVLHDGN